MTPPDDWNEPPERTDQQRRHESAQRGIEFGPLIERAAEAQMIRRFRDLGYDLSDIDDVNAFRDDLRFLRKQRLGMETRKAEGSKAVIIAIGGAIVGGVVSLITWLLAGGHRP